jgi:diguanylate cyclase (GGDEF)-like protein
VAGLVDNTISRLESERELKRHRQNLEDLVEERTAALTEANRRLEREIAERRRAEEEARHLAHHDSLTGLPNRLLFNDHLELALAQARRGHTRVALVMLDLDQFKSVNDSYGHAAGDELLRSVAGRLRALVRESDTVARIGGDEFALVLPDLSDHDAPARIAQKLADGFQSRFNVDGVRLRVGASVGVSVYPDDATDGDTLLRRADMNMYRTKGFGNETD